MPAPDACSPSLQALADTCQDALAYSFHDPELLYQALSILTPPLTPEQAAARQRLEFLGDAAWNFAVADTAFHLWPNASAGDLTRLRVTWSSRSGMARLTRQLGLPFEASSFDASPEGPSEQGEPERPPAATRVAGPAPHPGGPTERVVAELPRSTTRPDASASTVGPSDRVVAELFESVLGAMVMDGGLDPVRDLARRVIGQSGVPAPPPPMDPKSALQILAQSRFGTLPTYRLLDRWGPPHHPTFRVEVTVRGDAGNVVAAAEGSSRQAAEREAARRAQGMLSDRPT
jgi:ribonuclease-3